MRLLVHRVERKERLRASHWLDHVDHAPVWKPLGSSHWGVPSDLYVGRMTKCPVQGEGWWVGRVSKAGACCCDLGGR